MANMEVSVLLTLVDKLQGPLGKVGDSFRKFGDQAKVAAAKVATVGQKMALVGNQSIAAGKSLTRSLTLPLVALAGVAAKTAIDFNKGMANIATLIPGNTERINELGAAVRQMAKDTGTSTSDLSDGLYQVVSAFGDSADAVNQLDTANKAAIAGMSTTTDAINLLSAVTKGYGDTSVEAQKKASDLAFTTVRLGQTTFPELAASMGQVVPVASALNVSQEELFASFATLTGVTGNTSEVATQLRGAMSALMKPTTEMSKAITSLGYDTAESLLQSEGLVGGFRKLVGTTGGTTEEVGALFGRVEALNGVLALTGNQAETFDSKFSEMQNTIGATDAAFREQTEGVNKSGFSMKKLLATLKDLSITVGQMLLPALETFGGLLGGIADFFSSLPGPIKTAIVMLGGLAAALGPLLMLHGYFKKLKLLMKAFSFSPMVLGIMAVVAVTALLVSAFSETTMNAKEMRDAYDSVKRSQDRLKNNSALLDSLKKAEFGSDAYKQKLAEMIAMNPEMERLNLQVAGSFEEVESAITGVNEALDAKAKKEALDAYKAGVNQVGELADELMNYELALFNSEKGTNEYREALINRNAAEQDLKDQVKEIQRMGELSGVYSAGEANRAIRGEIRDEAALRADPDKATDFISAKGGVGQTDMQTQILSAASMLKEAAATPTELAGQIQVNIVADGANATASGSIAGGQVSMPISANSTGTGRR